MITVSADSHAARQLLSRSPIALADALEGTYNDASALMLREFTTYPPAPPRTSYRRTRTLGRSWSREFSGAGLGRRVVIGSNQNIAPYNRQVQDEEEQAPVHRGRWRNTAQDVARRNVRNVTTFLERRVAAQMARLGG